MGERGSDPCSRDIESEPKVILGRDEMSENGSFMKELEWDSRKKRRARIEYRYMLLNHKRSLSR